MGLSSGFMEPLESTSIHLIQRSVIRLLQMFPHDGVRTPDVHEFNQQMQFEMDNIRDFIILHYHVTNRRDTRVLETLRIDGDSRQPSNTESSCSSNRAGSFKVPTELFGENSWVQVMLGQGLVPEQYHPIVDMMSEEELKGFLEGNQRFGG